MLMNHVTGHGEEVGFGAADVLMVPNSQEPHENLLRKIGHFGGIRDIEFQEAAQPAAIPGCHTGYESSLVICGHDAS
jgi:hypothetical protein